MLSFLVCCLFLKNLSSMACVFFYMHLFYLQYGGQYYFFGWLVWVFGRTGIWTEGFTLAHLKPPHILRHFALVILEMGSWDLLCRLALNWDPPVHSLWSADLSTGSQWYCGMNSGLQTCEAHALPLEPRLQPCPLWLLWRWGLAFCLGQPGPGSSWSRPPA
jgi:hypothetical protein